MYLTIAENRALLHVVISVSVLFSRIVSRTMRRKLLGEAELNHPIFSCSVYIALLDVIKMLV